MTKEQFINKWWPACSTTFIDDLDTVIAHEIAKVQEAKLKPTDQVTDQVTDQEQTSLNPIAEAYKRGLKIRYKNWLKKDWIQKHNETKTIDNNCFINSVFSFGFIQHPQLWELYTEPTEKKIDPTDEDWNKSQLTEQPEKPSSQVKLDNSFDKERFEAMFRVCAIIGNKDGKVPTWDSIFSATEQALNKLDSYYASKEGGNNGI